MRRRPDAETFWRMNSATLVPAFSISVRLADAVALGRQPVDFPHFRRCQCFHGRTA